MTREETQEHDDDGEGNREQGSGGKAGGGREGGYVSPSD